MSRHSTVIIIAIIRLLSALPFAIFYSSLELYLININFHNTTAMVGSVLALSFGLSLLGGYLGGRYLNYKSLFLFSVIFQAIGCFVFTTHNHEIIIWLSSIFLLGSIGNTIGINMMLTQLFQANDHRREKSFFILYMCLNLGFLVGYSLAGHFENLNKYFWLPYINLAISCIAIVVILFFWREIDNSSIRKKIRYASLKIAIILSVTLFILRLLLNHPYLTNLALIVLWLSLAIIMYICITKNTQQKNDNIRLFYLLLFSALIFWSVYLLAPMALIVFIKEHVNLKFGHMLIAPQWIQSINTVIIIGGSLWFSIRIKNNSARQLKRQFAMGLLLIGLGFLTLTLGIITTTTAAYLSINWIILSYILQSLGELYIGPIGYSLVGKLIPETYQNIMTGVWATVLGVASAIASFLSSTVLSSKSHFNSSLSNYNHLFIAMSAITILFSFFLFYRKNGAL